MKAARFIPWDIYEEHLDEAAFLWAQWELALCASNYTLSEVAEGPEERLLAHLDGLVLGERPVAERLLLPALGADDISRVSAAAWVLLQAEDADHFETVWEALTAAGEAPRRQAISRALELSRRSDLPERLLPRLQGSAPEVKACVIDAISARGAAEVAKLSLQSLAAEQHPELLRAVLLAVQRVPDLAYVTLIERGLNSEHVETRAAAIEAGTLLGVPSTRGICRRLVAERAPGHRLAMGVLALGDDPRDRARLIEWSKAPDLAENALWALGFTGRVDIADLLLELLDDEKLAPLAAEAFATIAGLTIDGCFVKPGKSARLDEAFDDDGPVPEVQPADDLPMPQAEQLRAWWRDTKPGLDVSTRYVLGRSSSVAALQSALSRAPTWRRQVFRLGLPVELARRIAWRQWARTVAP